MCLCTHTTIYAHLLVSSTQDLEVIDGHDTQREPSSGGVIRQYGASVSKGRHLILVAW